jgi:hypothetical protein
MKASQGLSSFKPRSKFSSTKHPIQPSHTPLGLNMGKKPFSMQSRRKREGLNTLRDVCKVIFDLAHTATCDAVIGVCMPQTCFSAYDHAHARAGKTHGTL